MLAKLWNACWKRHAKPSHEGCVASLTPPPHSCAHTHSGQLAITCLGSSKPGRAAFHHTCASRHSNFRVYIAYMHDGQLFIGCRKQEAWVPACACAMECCSSGFWHSRAHKGQRGQHGPGGMVSCVISGTRWCNRLAITDIGPSSLTCKVLLKNLMAKSVRQCFKEMKKRENDRREHL